MLGNLLGVLFDGIAYGSLLFLISVGLSVTMGLMNFVNLAHGAFAMLGGYVCVVAMTRFGVPFLATLPLAFIVSGARRRRARAHAVPAALPARALSTRCCSRSASMFMAMAAATYFFGSSQQPVRAARVPARPGDAARRRLRRVPAVPDRRRDRASRSALALPDRAHALRRAGARRRSTTAAPPPASASTSAASSA